MDRRELNSKKHRRPSGQRQDAMSQGGRGWATHRDNLHSSLEWIALTE